MTETANVFGQWLMTDGIFDHYFLSGKTLCGEPMRPGLKRPWRYKSTPIDRWVDTRHRCQKCHKLNCERWAKL